MFQPVIQPTIPVKTPEIKPVKSKISTYVGLGVFFILLLFISKIVYDYNATLKFDDSGCLVDTRGVRIKEPIYETQTTINHRGTRTRTTNNIIGYKDCSKPMNPIFKYFLVFLGSAIVGGIVSGTIYQFQFNLANPQLSATMYASDRLNRHI